MGPGMAQETSRIVPTNSEDSTSCIHVARDRQSDSELGRRRGTRTDTIPNASTIAVPLSDYSVHGWLRVSRASFQRPWASD
jgi:hypothetical protein